MALLAGINPTLEALRARHPLDRVLIAKGAASPRLQEIINLCRERSIPVRFEGRAVLDRLSSIASHQGVLAFGAAHEYTDLDEIASKARMVVVLDGVEDPHNLGAIIRTTHAAGADALVIPERRAAGLTDTVSKSAAGALEHLPIARTGNITHVLGTLKKRGFWVYGLDERGDQAYDEIEYASPTVFVLGGEGKGVRKKVREHCDFLVRIPVAGKIASLNVSVAAGVVLFEWKRRLPRPA